jgi:hypothetical protein
VTLSLQGETVWCASNQWFLGLKNRVYLIPIPHENLMSYIPTKAQFVILEAVHGYQSRRENMVGIF